MKTSPTELVIMLDRTRPVTYSPMVMGLPKMLRKLRDQTSSKKAIVTPCITRTKKSHRSTAPSRAGTKLKPGYATVLRYRLMKPHRTMSIAIQVNSETIRAALPLSR